VTVTATDTRRTKFLSRFLDGLDTQVTVTDAPRLAELVNWRSGSELPMHRWFRYREGFSPELITELQLGHRLLDPFCGSGSIMVGAAQQSRTSVGIDVNPLATFVARVKLAPLTETEIACATSFAGSFPRNLTTAIPWPIPELRISTKVFEPIILEAVLRIRRLIEDFANESPRLRDFLLLAWLGILESVGSYFKEGNGIKYRSRKRLKTGYVLRADGKWQSERFGHDQQAFVCETFGSHLRRMLADARNWEKGSWADQRVLTGNSIELTRDLDAGSFDSVIFSPPYANRFDYFESLKVEMWFGGFVDSYDGMIRLRKTSLRSHLGASLTDPVDQFEPLEHLIEYVDRTSYAWRMRVPALLRGYFHDMRAILAGCRRLLRPGGQCCCVVGNSAYGGVIVPTDTIIALLGRQVGFGHAEVRSVRHLTVAPQQRVELVGLEQYMRESVVVFS
jgi:hypothetical protein